MQMNDIDFEKKISFTSELLLHGETLS